MSSGWSIASRARCSSWIRSSHAARRSFCASISLSFVPAVPIEQLREPAADRIRVEPELLETVAVARLVLARALALGEQDLAVRGRYREAQLAVDLLDRGRG